MQMNASPPIQEFSEFVQRSQIALQKDGLPAEVARFRVFVQTAESLLVRDLPGRLAAVLPAIQRIRQWLINPDYDVLSVAGNTLDENAHTRLIAWYLDPATHPETALKRQSVWLSGLGISQPIRGEAEPQTWVRPRMAFPIWFSAFPKLS